MSSSIKSLVAFSKFGSTAIMLFLFIASLVVSTGWACDIVELKRLFMSRAMTVQSGTAVASLLIIIASFINKACLTSIIPSQFTWLARILSIIVLVGSSATLLESFSTNYYSLNYCLWKPQTDSSGLTFPAPMAPNVSVAFVFLSLATFLLNWPINKKHWPYQYLCLFVLLASLTALFGFYCGADYLCTFLGCIKMTPSTSVLLLLMSLSLLMWNPERGITSVLVGGGLGGRMARSLSLVLAVVPVLLIIRKLLVQSQILDEAFAWAIFAIVVLSLIVFLIVVNASTIDKLSADKVAAETELQETAKKFQDYYTQQAMSQDPLNLSTQIRTKKVCLTCTKSYANTETVCSEDGTELTDLADDSVVGSVFAEKYFVISELGAGGMCTVYKARHLFVDQIYAIKILQAHLAKEPTQVKRFQMEAKTAMKLQHPNLLRVHDFGVTRQGQPFLLMEFIKGTSLSSLLQDIRRLDMDRFLHIFSQIFTGLAYAHEKGVIHRDLKPSNVMLIDDESENTRVNIVDFGLAKMIDTRESQQLTKSGEIFGSPLYMSPEQCGGLALDARSDIYSAGCMMYECLTGRVPHEGLNIIETLTKHLVQAASPFPAALRIDPNLESIVQKCLSKEPPERFQSASEVLEAMNQLKK